MAFQLEHWFIRVDGRWVEARGLRSNWPTTAKLFALHLARQIVIVRWFYPVPPTAIQRAARFSTWAPDGTRVWR